MGSRGAAGRGRSDFPGPARAVPPRHPGCREAADHRPRSDRRPSRRHRRRGPGPAGPLSARHARAARWQDHLPGGLRRRRGARTRRGDRAGRRSDRRARGHDAGRRQPRGAAAHGRRPHHHLDGHSGQPGAEAVRPLGVLRPPRPRLRWGRVRPSRSRDRRRVARHPSRPAADDLLSHRRRPAARAGGTGRSCQAARLDDPDGHRRRYAAKRFATAATGPSSPGATRPERRSARCPRPGSRPT